MNKFVLVGTMLSVFIAAVGCDVNKHMEDIGFKQGDNVVEKGTIKYDTLVDKDEVCEQKWSDIESNMQRRADLIPQLVATVKGSAAHENDTLTNVMKARAEASSIHLDRAAGDFEDANKFAQYQAAQQKVHTALQQLQENYPNLQANAAFHDLTISIEGTENRILRAREEYNKAVASFNQELRHVSGKVINPITGHEFHPREYFKMDPESAKAPSIDFNKSPSTTK